jgi:hypothetical protein
MDTVAEANKLAERLLKSAHRAKTAGLTATAERAEREAELILELVNCIHSLREENSQLRVMLDRCRPEEGVVRG